MDIRKLNIMSKYGIKSIMNTPSLEQYPEYANVCINNVVIFETKDKRLAKDIFFYLCKFDDNQWHMLLEMAAILSEQDIGGALAQAFRLHQS